MTHLRPIFGAASTGLLIGLAVFGLLENWSNFTVASQFGLAVFVGLVYLYGEIAQ